MEPTFLSLSAAQWIQAGISAVLTGASVLAAFALNGWRLRKSAENLFLSTINTAFWETDTLMFRLSMGPLDPIPFPALLTTSALTGTGSFSGFRNLYVWNVLFLRVAGAFAEHKRTSDSGSNIEALERVCWQLFCLVHDRVEPYSYELYSGMRDELTEQASKDLPMHRLYEAGPPTPLQSISFDKILEATKKKS